LKRIYISGAYTNGDTPINVATAIKVGDYFARLGYAVFIPHLTMFWHMIAPHEYDFWLEQDMEWLEVCDIIIKIISTNPSSGADKEYNRAIELGLGKIKVKEEWFK